MITATVSLNVTPLPDDDIAFANAAAWNTYWSAVQGTVYIDPADVTAYVPAAYDNSLTPVSFNIDGNDNIIPTVAMFQSLLNAFTALENSYIALRQQLYYAGLISNV